jgi:zinc protease
VTLQAITRDDVFAWHKANYTSSTTIALFVGDIKLEDAVALAGRTLGKWQSGSPPDRQVSAEPQHPTGPRVILVDRPSSSQSAIYLGGVGIGGGDPSMIPMTALQHVLGGGFNSRTNMNLREQHGYTYGAFTDFTTLRGTGWLANRLERAHRRDRAGPLRGAQGVQADRPGGHPAGRVVRGGEQPGRELPEQRADRAGARRARAAPAAVPAAPRLLRDLSGEAGRGSRPGRRSRWDGASWPVETPTLVAVGDLSQIEQPIRALGLGTVEVWDREGTKLK